MATTLTTLPIPPFFDPAKVEQIWMVDYDSRATEAHEWAKKHGVKPSASDKFKTGLLMIDAQITFCIPGAQLYVGGRSGRGAVEDNIRVCEFIYRNLSILTSLYCTLDTHYLMQIFNPFFWVNSRGEHPKPYTIITYNDAVQGVWQPNPALVPHLTKGSESLLKEHALHYTKVLADGGKYALTIWPYHAQLGGIEHALVPAVKEAEFFHDVARASQTGFETKGQSPVTENYSVLRPEVLMGPRNISIGQLNTDFVKKLLENDILIIAGQAKSHCVAWTIADLLDVIVNTMKQPDLVRKVYLLEDATSPVVVPGVIDYTDQANQAFERFRKAGMHVVQTSDPIDSWPNVKF